MKQSTDIDLQVPELKKGVRVGKQAQISLAMPPGLLVKVDEAANALSLTRTGFIKMCLRRAVEKN
jgi:hypothetical protein